MKNKIAATLVVVLGLVAVGLYASAYIVEEGQQVIVTQFGKPVAAVDQAGLNFKWNT